MKRIKFKFIYTYIFLICNIISLVLSAQTDSSTINTQSEFRKNSIYWDSGLNQSYVSINYDRIIPVGKNYASIRVGTMSFVEFEMLVEVNMMIGEKKHFFETGIGVYYDGDLGPGWRLGYRFQGKKGLLLRASPLIFLGDYKGDNNEAVNFAIGIGYSF